VLPDEIWVCDAEAYALAQATFPGQDVRLQPNTHLREQVERVAPSPDPRRRQAVLLMPEPAGSDWGGATAGRGTGAGLPARAQAQCWGCASP
jgi:hypothetical protein